MVKGRKICTCLTSLIVLMVGNTLFAGNSNLSLVVYYSFNNDANMMTDYSGNGSTLQNNIGTAATYTASGQVGGAAVFNGTNNGYDRLLSETNPAIYPNGAFSISTWLRPDVVVNNMAVSRPAGSNTGGFAIVTTGTAPTTDWRVTLYFTGGNNQISSGAYLTAGQWDHIAFTYDPNGEPNSAGVYENGIGKIYVNGELKKTMVPMKYKQDGFRFGLGFRASSSNNQWFAGAIDEFAVFDGILGQEQINGLYTGELTPLTVKPIVGDLDNNGIVDFRDFALLAHNWLKTN